MTVASTIAAIPPKTSAPAVVTLKWADFAMRSLVSHGVPQSQAS